MLLRSALWTMLVRIASFVLFSWSVDHAGAGESISITSKTLSLPTTAVTAASQAVQISRIWMCSRSPSELSVNIPTVIPHSLCKALRTKKAPKQKLYVFLGHFIDELSASPSASYADDLSNSMLRESSGEPVVDFLTFAPILLPSAKLAAITILQAHSAALSSENVQGIVLWQPGIPISPTTAVGLRERAQELAGTNEAQELSTPTLEQEIYKASLMFVDRIAEEFSTHKYQPTLPRRREFWIGTFSWPVLLLSGRIAPFYGLQEIADLDGLFVPLVPRSTLPLEALPPHLRLSSFEWILLQVLCARGLAEFLNVQLTVAPLYGDDSDPTLMESAVAITLTGEKACAVALQGADFFDPNRSTGSGMTQRGDFTKREAILANLSATMLVPTAVRWSSGSRNIAVLTSDGALGRCSENTTFPPQQFAEFLSLWLPLIHAGIPVQVYPFWSLSDYRISEKIRIGITSFSYQTPLKEELHALADWTRNGGILLLYDEGDQPTTASRGCGLGTSSRESSATQMTSQQTFFQILGLPNEIPDGTYRIGDGWLTFKHASPARFVWNAVENQRVVSDLADTTREARYPLNARTEWVSFSNRITTGWVIPTPSSQSFPLMGNYIDYLTTELNVRRNPRFASGEIFLVGRVPTQRTSEPTLLLGANTIVHRISRRDQILTVYTAPTKEESAAKLLLRLPSPPWNVEDTTSQEGLAYVWDSPLSLLEIHVCPETTSVKVAFTQRQP